MAPAPAGRLRLLLCRAPPRHEQHDLGDARTRSPAHRYGSACWAALCAQVAPVAPRAPCGSARPDVLIRDSPVDTRRREVPRPWRGCGKVTRLYVRLRPIAPFRCRRGAMGFLRLPTITSKPVNSETSCFTLSVSAHHLSHLLPFSFVALFSSDPVNSPPRTLSSPTHLPTSNTLFSTAPRPALSPMRLSLSSPSPSSHPTPLIPSPPSRHRPARPADPRSRVAAPGLPPLREPHALPVSRRHLQGRVPRPSPTPIAVDPQSLLAIATTFPPSTPRVGPSEPCEQLFLRSAPVTPCAHVHDGYNSAALPLFWPAGGPRYSHPAKRSDRNRAPALGALCQTPACPRSARTQAVAWVG